MHPLLGSSFAAAETLSCINHGLARQAAGRRSMPSPRQKEKGCLFDLVKRIVRSGEPRIPLVTPTKQRGVSESRLTSFDQINQS